MLGGFEHPAQQEMAIGVCGLFLGSVADDWKVFFLVLPVAMGQVDDFWFGAVRL
jgi:hypothetical protein